MDGRSRWPLNGEHTILSSATLWRVSSESTFPLFATFEKTVPWIFRFFGEGGVYYWLSLLLLQSLVCVDPLLSIRSQKVKEIWLILNINLWQYEVITLRGCLLGCFWFPRTKRKITHHQDCFNLQLNDILKII